MAADLTLPAVLKSRVHDLAEQRRHSANLIMLEAIQQYVEREEVRESFKQEGAS